MSIPQTQSTASAASPGEVPQRTIKRRAVEAAIWGMPFVSVDAMRQAYFRDAGAKYNDILYFSKPSDWRFQFTTPNASTLYFNFNLKDGPAVLDVPPTIGAGLFGSLVDAWEVPVTDVGPSGDDQGKGGKIPPAATKLQKGGSRRILSGPVSNGQWICPAPRHPARVLGSGSGEGHRPREEDPLVLVGAGGRSTQAELHRHVRKTPRRCGGIR
jgi:hypothetical protein